MTNVNKVGMKDLVNQMVEQYGYARDDSEAVLSDLVRMIAKHVTDGKSVELDGLGSFSTVEERDAKDRVTYRPVYTPGKAMRAAGESRTRLAAARERKFQKWAVKMIYQLDPDEAWQMLNRVSPITADTETGLVTLETLSSYYGMTKQYIYGILFRYEVSREKHPQMVRCIHGDGRGTKNGYDMRVALALAVLMCFGRKSVLNSRAQAVYTVVKASDVGRRAMEKAARLDRAPRRRRGRKKAAEVIAAVTSGSIDVAEPVAAAE